MKRIALLAILILGIVFSQSIAASQAEAADFYVGTSDTTGRDCYLMTETIRKVRSFSDGGLYVARLKMVRSASNIQYLDYELEISTSGLSFINSEGYSGQITQYDTPIEYNMCQYIWSHRL